MMLKFPRRSTAIVILVLLFVLLPIRSSHGQGDTYSLYREQDQTWIIGNRFVQAAFQLASTGQFRSRWLKDNLTSRLWRGRESDKSSPINLTVDGTHLDGSVAYTLISHSFDSIVSPAPGVRFTIVLALQTLP